jgi:hypothetical protein
MTVSGGRDNDFIINTNDSGSNGTRGDEDTEEDSSGCRQKLELSFEYLMNNQELQWVTIVSSQAILMSLCLQSIVEELLRMRNGAKIKAVR